MQPPLSSSSAAAQSPANEPRHFLEEEDWRDGITVGGDATTTSVNDRKIIAKSEPSPTLSTTVLVATPNTGTSTNVRDGLVRTFVIEAESMAEPLGIIDCSDSATLVSVRHQLSYELSDELNHRPYKFLYHSVKLTQRQEQLHTIGKIAARRENETEPSVLSIRFHPPAVSATPVSSSSYVSLLDAERRLGFNQHQNLHMTSLPPALNLAEAKPPPEKRRKLESDVVEGSPLLTEEVNESSLLLSSLSSLPPPTSSVSGTSSPTTGLPRKRGRPSRAEIEARERAALDVATIPTSTNGSMQSMPAFTDSDAIIAGRRYRRSNQELLKDWFAKDRRVRRCFLCGRVFTTATQRLHRCEHEPADRRAQWLLDRQNMIDARMGGEIVIPAHYQQQLSQPNSLPDTHSTASSTSNGNEHNNESEHCNDDGSDDDTESADLEDLPPLIGQSEALAEAVKREQEGQ